MPRPKRADEANGIYHALNRGNAKSIIFKKDADFDAFERIVAQGLDRYPCQIFAYQLMGTHWPLTLRQSKEFAPFVFLSAILRTSVTPRFIFAAPVFSDRDQIGGREPAQC